MRVKKPKFQRQNPNKKRVQKKWRHPRGIDSLQQCHDRSKGRHPRVGYGSPRVVRGMHPTGVREFLVYSMADLAHVGEGMAARLSSTLGGRKRGAIEKAAEQKKIKVLN